MRNEKEEKRAGKKETKKKKGSIEREEREK